MSAKTLLTKVRAYLLDILGENVIGAADNGTWAKAWPDSERLPTYKAPIPTIVQSYLAMPTYARQPVILIVAQRRALIGRDLFKQCLSDAIA